jgi:cytochrome c oxidase cbb3-type subunit III
MMRTIGVRAATVSLIVLAVWAVGQAEEASPDRQQLAFRAEGLLLSRCAVCHSTDLVTQQRLDRGRWEATISKMIHWGADVSKEEAGILATYLSARYNPDAPDQEPAHATGSATELLRVETNAATGRPVGETGPGEIVYAHNCQACHGSGAAGGVGPRLAGNPILGDEDHFWETVLHGRGAMPAWESALNAQEIADVRAWLQTIR